ncbi:phytoene desaturase family protein [Clostridium weizhouense]|uniref:Phytoene desaturase n=1 Tax=Clostridium weizhouense TaxID=2859781 RepID=A0ABS7ALH9_9CLOT|nr:phytoene desaturase family protein [Clostridium weizhouense]MBW6409520.1 phytoene desaturase [Clostridium weizhouense]
MNKKAIIIGAGVGGLSLGARLLSKGFEVEILEKNLTIGGKTNLLEYGGFKFNLTASLLMFYTDYIEIFKYCNKNYKDYFSLIPLKTLYKVFYYDNTTYNFDSELSSLSKKIYNITEGNINDIYGYFNFISYNYQKYLISNKYFLNRAFFKTNDFINPNIIYKTLDLRTLPSCYKDCKKHIKNKKLIDYLLFQSMYIGVSPYDASNIYNSIPAVTQIEGLYHIKGGIYSYIKALEKLILNQNGIIKTKHEVKKILFDKNNNAIGVLVNNEKKFADLIICNSDYSYTIDKLIENNDIKKLFKPIDKLKYSCSTFILYLGLNKKYPILNVNNIYINKNFKKNINAPFKGLLSKNPSLYIYCPSSIDNSVCPNGYEIINIMVRVPNLLYNKINWNFKTIANIKNQILNLLSSIDTLNDIRDHIVLEKYLTPLDFYDTFNTYNGCAFGLSHTLNQTNIFRPQSEIKGIKNLFFTGASTHPGNGISMVLKSSKICCDRICDLYKL